MMQVGDEEDTISFDLKPSDAINIAFPVQGMHSLPHLSQYILTIFVWMITTDDTESVV